MFRCSTLVKVLGIFALGSIALLGSASSIRAQGVDNPLPVELFVPAKVTLDKNEFNHFMISLPAGDYKIILDIRNSEGKSTNLQAGLSILDSDGAVVKDRVIRFNEIDIGFRRVYDLSLKKPTKVGLKLTNYIYKANFWLTVLKMPSTPAKQNQEEVEGKQANLKESDLREYDPKNADLIPFPFFGNIMPTLLLPGQTKTGRLDTHDSAYFITALPKGEHKVVLGFDNAEGKRTNIQGYLALLNADGGEQKTLIGMNEIDVSSRKAATITLKQPAVMVMRIKCSIYSVNYTVSIRPSE